MVMVFHSRKVWLMGYLIVENTSKRPTIRMQPVIRGGYMLVLNSSERSPSL